ncbi:MAG: helix-turn-helix domain-containing protein, partial [Methanomassiliicoccales archaeon]
MENSLHRIESTEMDKIITPLRRESVRLKEISKKEVWVESKSCTGCRTMASLGVPVVSTKSNDKNHVLYTMLFESKRSAEKALEEIAKRGLKCRITEITDAMPTDLTAREKELLFEAVNHGYFDEKRGISLTDLAERLGISVSSASALMKRTLKKISFEYITRHP